MEVRWVEATADEWADFVSQFIYTNYEGPPEMSDRHTSMLSKADGQLVGKVRYHDNVQKTYYINKAAEPPKK